MTGASLSPPSGRWLSIVGLGEDGVHGLSPRAAEIVAKASLVIGGRRHLALAESLIEGTMLPWASPIEETFPVLLDRRGQNTCVLATGDPFHYGIGATLARFISPNEMDVLPQASAFSLAAARLGWALQDCTCLSLHGRALERLIPELQPGTRMLILSWDRTTPAAVAQLLRDRGFGESTITVCEALGGNRETLRHVTASGFDLSDILDLNTIAIEARCRPDSRYRSLAAGLPDGFFENDGQITKAPIRAVTLSALAPRRGALLWDIGGGSGSVAVEWLLSHPSTRAIVVEQRGDRADRIRRNGATWGVAERLTVLQAVAPDCLSTLPPPDAVFIGGGLTLPAMLPACRNALPSGGRLVANAVTLEGQGALGDALKQWGGELLTLSVAQAEPIGGFYGLRPSMPNMQWRWTKA